MSMKRDNWSDRIPNQTPVRPIWNTSTSTRDTTVRIPVTLISAALSV